MNESSNLDLFLAKLSAYYAVPLYKRESVIIFDEVQQFPRARQLIKYLVADGRYDYIETSSFIRKKERKKRNISFLPFPNTHDFETTPIRLFGFMKQ